MSASSTVATMTPHHDRAWWRAEAVRTKTDWSSLLRQRIKVRAWIKAGRPPMGAWMKEQNISIEENHHDDDNTCAALSGSQPAAQ